MKTQAVKHTPGPWEVVGASEIVKTGEDWACIARINNPRPLKSALPYAQGEPLDIGHPRFHEAAANARLIAAAPELGQLLLEVSPMISHHMEGGKCLTGLCRACDVKAALTKAGLL